MSEREWHYVHERSREGPIAESVLRARLENAELPMDILVWTDASLDWTPAHEEPAFQDVEPRPRPKAAPAKPSPQRSPAVSPRNGAPPPAARPPQPAITPPAAVAANIYLNSSGSRYGPFTHQDVVRMFNAGTFSGLDFVWQEGMATWVPLHTFLGVPPPASPAPTVSQPVQVAPVSQAPVTSYSVDSPGIGRRAYAGWTLAAAAMVGLFSSRGNDLSWLFSVISVGLFALRLRNIGYSGWYALPLSCVCVLNFVICLALPPGYAHTRQLDTSAKAVAFSFVGLAILIAVFASKH